jgi:predicted DNA-binding transcriptional regulator YafY
MLDAPIEFDRQANGYRYAADDGPGAMPGLWCRESQLRALAIAAAELRALASGPVEEVVAPILAGIEAILTDEPTGHPELNRRIRVLSLAPRTIERQQFRRLAGALLQRHRVRILYHSRSRGETTDRVVSPQRLVYFRDNWTLEAWCHMRHGLRSFEVHRCRLVDVLDETAVDVDDERLDDHLGPAYGIGTGPAERTAVLRFRPAAARWVADERWRGGQRVTFLADGGLELRVPYGNEGELIRDVLRYGADVEVVEPSELREAVKREITEAVMRYYGE